MKFPTPQESRAYGNPEDWYAAKQAEAANKAARAIEAAKESAVNAPKRPILTLKSRKTDQDWSEARQAAESLFTPPRTIREPQITRRGATPLDPVRREELSKP
jgi:hypothetical protein